MESASLKDVMEDLDMSDSDIGMSHVPGHLSEDSESESVSNAEKKHEKTLGKAKIRILLKIFSTGIYHWENGMGEWCDVTWLGHEVCS